MAGLYIHIPFCKNRCIYCGFYSTTLNGMKHCYVDALCKEMLLRSEELGDVDSTVTTIYLGGGTPSQLSIEQLQKIFLYIYKVYSVAADAEITMECNPDDVTKEYALSLQDLPINRISMGAQTFSDDRLKFLHRRHTSKQVTEAVENLRKTGVKNISVDLMFGFPEETLQEWTTDIKHCQALDVEHISAYSLMYEEGTRLYEMACGSKSAIKPVHEETSLEMYEKLIDMLENSGYEHYEISNFARCGFRSIHNGNYWNGTPYTGLGAAAHSYDRFSRRWNVSDVRKYIDTLEKGILPVEEVETLDVDMQYDDVVVTALRTREGIDIETVDAKFGNDYKRYLIDSAGQYIKSGMLAISNGRLFLTRRGLFISDTIMSDLMHPSDS
ncbi:MAG: radical SAM family heme chaperone HemW [Prevotellaceae bacterium]|nr:radical SAM family heme chaperone HemW [Prevotella sp.]MDD7257222.1 radical SAM family heme chaperone HemW [Prevotellaceae bacterium]MDY6130682.1 radical SAM family heme chaperone HemW [Prevotella sp.]